jgi:hypothetical protein
MHIPTKILLISIYPALLLARLANLVLRQDRLRLHDLPSGESYWIERSAQPNTQSYFFEESWVDVGGELSVARLLSRFLCNIAHFYAPRRRLRSRGTIYKATAEREQGIPDEIYTLW